MKQAILTAMLREFQEDHSLCPRTYRALRTVVENTHAEQVGGNAAADQAVNSEAKAAITRQTQIGTANRQPWPRAHQKTLTRNKSD